MANPDRPRQIPIEGDVAAIAAANADWPATKTVNGGSARELVRSIITGSKADPRRFMSSDVHVRNESPIAGDITAWF